MKTKHTPGPWYGTNTAGDHQGLICSETTGKSIAVSYDIRDTNIIEAAPDLLEACQKVKNLANRLLDYGEIDQEIAGELLLIVNPIIKKAGAE